MLAETEKALEKIQQQEAALRREKEATQQALDNVRSEERKRRAAERENISKRINDIKTLISVGDTQEAKRRLNAALQIAPDNPRLLELKKQLQ